MIEKFSLFRTEGQVLMQGSCLWKTKKKKHNRWDGDETECDGAPIEQRNVSAAQMFTCYFYPSFWDHRCTHVVVPGVKPARV